MGARITVNPFILTSIIFGNFKVQVYWYPFNLPRVLQHFTFSCMLNLKHVTQHYRIKIVFHSKYIFKHIHTTIKWFKNIYVQCIWRSNFLIMRSYPCIFAYFTIYWWYIYYFISMFWKKSRGFPMLITS